MAEKKWCCRHCGKIIIIKDDSKPDKREGKPCPNTMGDHLWYEM